MFGIVLKLSNSKSPMSFGLVLGGGNNEVKKNYTDKYLYIITGAIIEQISIGFDHLTVKWLPLISACCVES